jgi:hypothetical protein
MSDYAVRLEDDIVARTIDFAAGDFQTRSVLQPGVSQKVSNQ